MSSERQSGDPTPEPEAPADSEGPRRQPNLAELVRERGAPLIEGLGRHVSGSLEHAEGSGSYAFATAVELGHDRDHSELVREIAKLHDVGKVYVPIEVLTKPREELTAEELEQLDAHHEAAYKLARGAGLPDDVCGWILRVRERFDGQGPESLAPDAIPIESRIARAACACDRALSDPPVASADASLDERRRSALEQLRRQAGHELDPHVVGAMVAVLERAPSTVG